MPLDELMLPGVPRNRRQAYYRQYGLALARQAEFDVLVGLVLAMSGASKDEFFDRVETLLHDEDAVRALKAGH
jgi:hypothetical protein